MTLVALSVAVAAVWSAGAPLPEPRTEVASAPLRAEIVVIGGFLASGANSRRVDAYRPATDRWRRRVLQVHPAMWVTLLGVAVFTVVFGRLGVQCLCLLA